MVFLGSVYYPDGGMEDFKGDFSNLVEALGFANTYFDDKKWYNEEEFWNYHWAHIWDNEDRTMINLH